MSSFLTCSFYSVTSELTHLEFGLVALLRFPKALTCPWGSSQPLQDQGRWTPSGFHVLSGPGKLAGLGNLVLTVVNRWLNSQLRGSDSGLYLGTSQSGDKDLLNAQDSRRIQT